MSADINSAPAAEPSTMRLFVASVIAPPLTIMISTVVCMITGFFLLPGGVDQASNDSESVSLFINLLVFTVIIFIVTFPMSLVLGIAIGTPIAFCVLYTLCRSTKRITWKRRRIIFWASLLPVMTASCLGFIWICGKLFSPDANMTNFDLPNVFETWLISFAIGSFITIPLILQITQIKSISRAAETARAK